MTIPLPDPFALFESKVVEFLLRHNLLTANGSPPRFREWAVAVSGGGDSVFLCHLLKRLVPPAVSLNILHFNHRTDERKNREDQDFVESLSKMLDLPFLAGFSPSSEGSRRGLSETVLRQERHAFFDTYLSTHPQAALFLGHQLDDRIETILANLFRGGGPRSLVGIAEESRGRIYRPLLEFEREEIRHVLVFSGLSYRDDPANMDPAHLRNRIRHNLRGEIDRFFPPHGTRHLGHLATLMERETSLPPLSSSLLCEEERPGQVRFSLFLYHSLRPSAQGLFLRTLLNRQKSFGLPIPPERNLLRTLELSDPEKKLLNYPLGKDWEFSIVFGRADLIYKYPETDTWRYDLISGIHRDDFTSVTLALPRGGTLLIGSTPASVDRMKRSGGPGMTTSIILTEGTATEDSFSLRYWASGLQVLPDREEASPKSVSSIWKNRPWPFARKFLVPVLCRGPYAVWIPGTLDRTERLPKNESGIEVTLTYQVRERSEWKRFLESP